MIYKIEELGEVVKFFLSHLGGGRVVGLSGNLGAGKTTFTKELLKTLGHEGNVVSPTFVLRRDYDLGVGVGWGRLIHIDAYRLEKPTQIYQVISKEELVDKNNLVFVEWPENIFDGVVGENIFDKIILFEHVDENTRKISTV
jgi:tRNA threonylcarbamoyladenosine biosynthesis protein TsaE